jgi:CDP-diacylglycerol---glycerol-3-phosphate 3-phosphatidyltransferase
VSLSLLSLLAALGLAFLSMAVFALRGYQRDKDADAKSAQFLGGFGDFLLQWWFHFVVSPLTRLSLALGISANGLSYISMAIGVVAGALFFFGQLELGAWTLILSGVADMIDGRVARATGTISRYGTFMDTMFDRFTEFFMFLGFAYILRGTLLGPIAVVAAIGGSLLVSYARAAGEILGVDCTGGLMQRGERLALICLVCLTDRSTTAWLGLPFGFTLVWALLLLGVMGFATAIQRTVWIARRVGLRPAQAAGDATADAPH